MIIYKILSYIEDERKIYKDTIYIYMIFIKAYMENQIEPCHNGKLVLLVSYFLKLVYASIH